MRFENLARHGLRLRVLSFADQKLRVADGSGGVAGKRAGTQRVRGRAVGREVHGLLVREIGLLNVSCFECGITSAEGILGQGQFLLPAGNFPVRVVIDGIKRGFSAGTGMDR